MSATPRTHAPPSLKGTLLANYAGKAWIGLMGVVFLPIYLSLLGAGPFALVGIYTTLFSLLTILDLGLSTTLNRELARRAADGAADARCADLVRTFEVLYLATGVAAGVLVAGAAPLLAHHWLNVQPEFAPTVVHALLLMALVTALQWPTVLYAGGLAGLDRQVQLNVARCVFATCQGGGAALLLWLVAPSISLFFAWQVAMYLLQALTLRRLLFAALPGGGKGGRFHVALLKETIGFSAGMLVVTILGTLLTQLDKVILMNRLSLEDFSYYSMAATAASLLGLLTAPVFAAVFPVFSRLAAHPDHARLVRIYHQACQVVALVMLPALAAAALFPHDLIWAWLRDPHAVGVVAPLFALLAAGSALNGLMLVPLALQLGHGWISLSIIKNTIALAAMVPLTLALVQRYGAAGAAMAWLALNAAYVVVEIPLMHRRLLRGEAGRWFLSDFGLPLLTCSACVGGACLVLPAEAGVPVRLAALAVAAAVGAATAAALMPETALSLRALLRRRKAAGTGGGP